MKINIANFVDPNTNQNQIQSTTLQASIPDFAHHQSPDHGLFDPSDFPHMPVASSCAMLQYPQNLMKILLVSSSNIHSVSCLIFV